jgi:hypothetical protein
MIKIFSFFQKETGVVASKLYKISDHAGFESDLRLNTPIDHMAIEGQYDHLSKRVDIATGQVIDYQPPAPSADHEWNADTKRWQLSAAAQANAQTRTAATARIAELVASQHRHVRGLALDKPGAREALQAIDGEIAALEAEHGA